MVQPFGSGYTCLLAPIQALSYSPYHLVQHGCISLFGAMIKKYVVVPSSLLIGLATPPNGTPEHIGLGILSVS
jgi:hypothetical protein